jgi:hypothetical protein
MRNLDTRRTLHILLHRRRKDHMLDVHGVRRPRLSVIAPVQLAALTTNDPEMLLPGVEADVLTTEPAKKNRTTITYADRRATSLTRPNLRPSVGITAARSASPETDG